MGTLTWKRFWDQGSFNQGFLIISGGVEVSKYAKNWDRFDNILRTKYIHTFSVLLYSNPI